jgi:GNAT superfamily N-acetyltransferase
MTSPVYEQHPGEQALAMLDDIAGLYDEINAELPSGHFEMFSHASFITRTSGQARRAGFRLVTASAQGKLVGFSFGHTFPPGVWWANCTQPTAEVLGATKLAVIELDVQRDYRRQGISKRLLGDLLAGRDEDYATLATEIGSVAYAMYIRWGWYKVGTFDDLPPMDALIIPLRQAVNAETS